MWVWKTNFFPGVVLPLKKSGTLWQLRAVHQQDI
nr:MAG TPA_asm: hypothetical protein [Bacteriophage sp.]